MRRIVALIILLVIFKTSNAQKNSDSLRFIIAGNHSDSLKISAYNALCQSLMNQPSERMAALKEMVLYCDQIKIPRLQALCLRKIGVAYGNINEFDKALEFSFKSAELFEKLNHKEGLANCYNNIASFYNNKGSLTGDRQFYNRSVDYHLKSINLRTEINDTSQLVNSYNNIGSAYLSMEDHEKALEYFKKAYEIYVRKGDQNALHMININLGDCYFMLGIKEKNPGYLRTALHYMLGVYRQHSQNDKSSRYSELNISIGNIYCETGNLTVGIPFLLKGLEIAEEIDDKSAIMGAASGLSDAYEKSGNHKKALDMLKLYLNYKDSLINEKNISSIEQMQTAYQTSQKDRQIDQLNSEKAIKDAKLGRQRTIIFSVIGAIISAMIMVIIIWSRYNLKKKANMQLHEAYQKIEFKNRQITDSINYAKRIQQAILPPNELLQKELKNFFVYYAPKDIVSGDFYWYTEHNGLRFFAVVDCTGHGVPGALMSMIGNTLLHEIINQKNITSPGDILFHLDKGVKNALRQSGSDMISQDDGMDISLCRIDLQNPTLLQYACANHSIFIKSGKTVTELYGDIYSIGGDYSNVEKQFETKTFTLQEDSFIILSSDGYYDQFGGEKSSKFLISRFEELIKNTDLQKTNAAEEFSKAILLWRGLNKQTDDVLVAGFKV